MPAGFQFPLTSFLFLCLGTSFGTAVVVVVLAVRHGLSSAGPEEGCEQGGYESAQELGPAISSPAQDEVGEFSSLSKQLTRC